MGNCVQQGHLQPAQLSAEEIVRAWEDPEYRRSMTPEQKKMMPAHPAGEIIGHRKARSNDPQYCLTEVQICERNYAPLTEVQICERNYTPLTELQ